MARRRNIGPVMTLAKYFVAGINFMASIFGIILIALGGFIYQSESGMVASIAVSELDTIIIVIGLTICSVSIVGIYGAIRESGFLLKMYFAIIATLVSIQTLIGLVAFAYRGQIDEILDKGWDTAYNGHQKLIEDVETAFICCGYKSLNDRAVPSTCSTSRNISNSCFSSVQFSFDNYLHVIGIAGAVFGALEIFSLYFSVLLVRKIRRIARHEQLLLQTAQKLEADGKLEVGVDSC